MRNVKVFVYTISQTIRIYCKVAWMYTLGMYTKKQVIDAIERAQRQVVTTLRKFGCSDDEIKRITGHASSALRAYDMTAPDVPHETLARAVAELLNIGAFGHPQL